MAEFLLFVVFVLICLGWALYGFRRGYRCGKTDAKEENDA